EKARNEKEIAKILTILPVIKSIRRSEPESINDYFTDVYYEKDWQISLIDSKGHKFFVTPNELSSDGSVVQELDIRLSDLMELLPNRYNDQKVYYISS